MYRSMPMKKQVILCPNCASPIHLLDHGVECQYCGKGISGYDEDLSTFLERLFRSFLQTQCTNPLFFFVAQTFAYKQGITAVAVI